MKDHIPHTMVRTYNDGSVRMSNTRLHKTKFKWTFKNPCKLCLVRACCSKSRLFSCIDVICYEITWSRFSRIFKRYFCMPIFCISVLLIHHYGHMHIRETHIPEITKVILIIVLTLVLAPVYVRFIVWALIIKGKGNNL